MKGLTQLLCVLVLLIFIPSCKSQKDLNSYSLPRDSITQLEVYKVVDQFPTFLGGLFALM